jgi:hypothetical protein
MAHGIGGNGAPQRNNGAANGGAHATKCGMALAAAKTSRRYRHQRMAARTSVGSSIEKLWRLSANGYHRRRHHRAAASRQNRENLSENGSDIDKSGVAATATAAAQAK